MVEGQPVPIPDRVGCALIAGLHASEATSLDKALEDLRRALLLFDDDVWRQAADLARSVGAGSAFAAALHRESTGADLAARLGLTITDPVMWFCATSLAHGAGSLGSVLAQGDWADRARRLRDAAFPSRPLLAGSWPIARRGRGGLAAAHLGRVCVTVTRLPGLLLAWHRTCRALRRWGRGEPACRPGSVPRLRAAAVIHLGLPLPAASCGLPASIGRAALDRSRREPLVPLLALLRVGFTEPPQSPAALVVSYTTVSPLPPR